MDYIIPLYHDINILISKKIHKVENRMNFPSYETDIESMEKLSLGWIVNILQNFGYC